MAGQVWRKSSRSATGANCLEVAYVVDIIWLRDSKLTVSRRIYLTKGSWDAFLHWLNARTP
ncbi:DUF397 domain-containing protein [Streptomyces sp. NRRL B-1140]|uniref:DUF397 domain-containing protein n=1 Tax=Streptomyces sp. NRRL B-1140 TaxID=1415549 RepID=UPI00131AD511